MLQFLVNSSIFEFASVNWDSRFLHNLSAEFCRQNSFSLACYEVRVLNVIGMKSICFTFLHHQSLMFFITCNYTRS